MSDFQLPLPDLEDLETMGWWESFRCDKSCTEDARAYVVTPSSSSSPNEARKPAPVLLFLSGNGHVDDREPFFVGGVDIILRNERIRRNFVVISPKPMSNNGLLRYTGEGWARDWAEDATWSFFTEILRRLGPEQVDRSRLYVTGISLGA